jgi:hypothetical protein
LSTRRSRNRPCGGKPHDDGRDRTIILMPIDTVRPAWSVSQDTVISLAGSTVVVSPASAADRKD